jgi:hypothetical protein
VCRVPQVRIFGPGTARKPIQCQSERGSRRDRADGSAFACLRTPAPPAVKRRAHCPSRISLIPHAIPPQNGLQGITGHFAILVSGKNHRLTASGLGSPGPHFFRPAGCPWPSPSGVERGYRGSELPKRSSSVHRCLADLLTCRHADLPLFSFFSARSFHAVCSAPRSESSSASASRMCVIPIRPQPPCTGRN